MNKSKLKIDIDVRWAEKNMLQLLQFHSSCLKGTGIGDKKKTQSKVLEMKTILLEVKNYGLKWISD